ncbi:MAG: tRNA uridine-5-carboxymethylaminomethyl(34) synthesis GTPase MnmE [Clostridia bacterium]|nr:tRNA uridine-5-carboxymethylaminomethyl(34) synthesis GTPase MnmE [Clostridia bacterium]
MDNRTIAAISTPQGVGGIAVIRISGENSIAIADSIFKGKTKLSDAPTHTVHYGKIINNGEEIDEVLVTVMRAPKTFTREDVVEISTHGGYVASRRVLNTLFEKGAYPAMAGEFTKRAFMNGRIDLSQAEAVIDIINAKTDLAQKNALTQADGHLAKRIEEIRSTLTNLAAAMQVSIDYPDEDLEELTAEEISEQLGKVYSELSRLADTAPRGRVLKNGIKTAIIGRPNVGKSSLLNYLAMEERAIVTDIAGTTRDVIEELVDLDGVPLRLLDTAGIRSTEDTVEKIGVERSLKYIDEAELILLVLDAKSGLTEEDRELLSKTQGKNRIVLVNKTDECEGFFVEDAIMISAKTGAGISEMSAKIKELYSLEKITAEEITLTNERQLAALLRAKEAVLRAVDVLGGGMEQDFAALDINEALAAIGEIDGRTVTEDIVSEVFHNFCVGK